MEVEVKKIAEHYSERASENKAARRKSKIVALRNLNNWVKSVLISLHTRPGYSVLDLACGKGGDLQKWQSSKIAKYVGSDISRNCLEQVCERYNHLKQPTFVPRLLCGDCFHCRLTDFLETDRYFNLVSCQFSFHYAFNDEKRLRQAFQNISERLLPGGFFIGTIPDANVWSGSYGPQIFKNEIYRIVFDEACASQKVFPVSKPFGIRYMFYLESSVLNIPEYLVPPSIFEKMALEYGLEMQLFMNFHEFIEMYLSPQSPYVDLFYHFFRDRGTKLSPELWDAAYLYAVFAFKKQGAEPSLGVAPETVERISSVTLTDKDIIDMSALKEEENKANGKEWESLDSGVESQDSESDNGAESQYNESKVIERLKRRKMS
eukprot:jgi/Galph1/1925/GphlegSOOS_G613.1